MAGREPVKRWGSINHEVSLLLMVMLTREERPSINFWCRFFIFHSLISIASPC